MDNCLLITGTVARQPEIRTSPAGIPISRFMLLHRSQRQEAGVNRKVECALQVLACGHELEQTARELRQGDEVRISGFLGRSGHPGDEAKLLLHAERIERLQPQGVAAMNR